MTSRKGGVERKEEERKGEDRIGVGSHLRGQLQLDIVTVQGPVKSPKHTREQFGAHCLYTSNKINQVSEIRSEQEIWYEWILHSSLSNI